MRFKKGSPLPLGAELHWISQLQSIFPFADVDNNPECVHSVHILESVDSGSKQSFVFFCQVLLGVLGICYVAVPDNIDWLFRGISHMASE